MSRSGAGIKSAIELERRIDEIDDAYPAMALTLRLLCGWSVEEIRAVLRPGTAKRTPTTPPPNLAMHVPPEMVRWCSDPVCWTCVERSVKAIGDQCRACVRNEQRRIDRLLEGKASPYTERTHRTHWASLEDRRGEIDAIAFREWQGRQ